MTNKRTSFLTFLLLAFQLVATGGCDFQAAEDAFDDFDIIIGLDPINTVISGVIVDSGSGDLINAQLTFSGPDAAIVIDAYSDPISTLHAEGGTLTFGIRNSSTPTEGSPVEITVTASADNYFTTSRKVNITEIGEGFFEIQMTRNNVNAPIAGTSGQSDSRVSTGSSGAVQQSVTIQTQNMSSGLQAQLVVNVPQNNRPVTSNGSALVGPLSTDIRVFDSASGLDALPAGAKKSSSGTSLALVGATFFRMSDGAGNVAVNFLGASGKSSAACAANATSLVLTSSKAEVISVIQAAGGAASVDVYAYTPADGQNALAGTITATLENGLARLDVCFGAAGAPGTLNTAAIGNASAGIIFTFALSGSAVSTQVLNNTVSVSNPQSAPINAVFRLVGPGINIFQDKTVPAGSSSFSMGNLVGELGPISVVQNGSYSLSATFESGATVSTPVSNPASGSTSITLPSSLGLVQFDFTVTMACPAGQKFEVQVSESSLDALQITYKAQVADAKWKALPSGAAANPQITSGSVVVGGTLMMRPNTTYQVIGTLGDKSGSVMQTSPGTAGAWKITIPPDDIGLSCK